MPTDNHIVEKSELVNWIGRRLGPTDWTVMSQQRINHFADTTCDHQFIHVDEVAASKTPLGGTIAHGYFSLSMLAWFSEQASVTPKNTSMILNYGLDKVRFLHPVHAGKRIRATVTPLSFEDRGLGKILCKNSIRVEIEGNDTPALLAESLFMYILT